MTGNRAGRPPGASGDDADRTLPPGVTLEEVGIPANAEMGSDPLVGVRLGEYVVSKKIGSGGMGVVYEARQPVIGRRVAIKVLRWEMAEHPQEMQRLLTEARAVTAVHHPGIVDVIGFGQAPDGRQYMAMEFLEGDSLEDLVAPMPPVEVVEILDQVLDALHAAHSVGVIHRDIKPANIFLLAGRRGARRVKLLDFGLAKTADQAHGSVSQTFRENAAMVGTPEYAAPEQSLGMSVSPQSDLYSVGIVAFEMLTGRLPFVSENRLAAVKLHIETPPPAPSSLVPSIREGMDSFVLGLLAKDPAARPRSAAEARAAVRDQRRDLAESPTQHDPGATTLRDRPGRGSPGTRGPGR